MHIKIRFNFLRKSLSVRSPKYFVPNVDLHTHMNFININFNIEMIGAPFFICSVRQITPWIAIFATTLNSRKRYLLRLPMNRKDFTLRNPFPIAITHLLAFCHLIFGIRDLTRMTQLIVGSKLSPSNIKMIFISHYEFNDLPANAYTRRFIYLGLTFTLNNYPWPSVIPNQ